MIYCYGLIDKYEAALDSGELFKRAYTNPLRTGGDVFETYEEAWRILVDRKSTDVRRVYGVLADWETDTIPVPGKPWRHLKQQARIVRVPAPAG